MRHLRVMARAEPLFSGGRPTLRSVTWGVVECRDLARELLGSGAGSRWAHVFAVATTAHVLADPVGDEIIECAAWLHDVGYAEEVVDTGMHAIDGAGFLDREGVPRGIVSLVAFHTGAEYEAQERGLIDKLIQFERPPQDQLDALILADLISSPTGERISVSDRLDEVPLRYEPQHPVHRAILRARPYLEECAERAAKRFNYPM